MASGAGGTAAGLLYVGREQGKDAVPVFTNTDTSAAFANFVELLGEKVN